MNDERRYYFNFFWKLDLLLAALLGLLWWLNNVVFAA